MTKLVLAISSRALFNLSESDAIYNAQGIAEYAAHQAQRVHDILEPGVGFALVEKLLQLNQSDALVEVILLSRNSAETGMRVFNSIQHYGLDITRAAFTAGQSPYRYVRAFKAHLFISTDASDVRRALESGCAAATLLAKPQPKKPSSSKQIKIAFDGDAVLFSDASERIYKTQGLAAFTKHETENAVHPMDPGPFKGFLSALNLIQSHFSHTPCPIRTALVTARQAPTHERIIRTLHAWGIRIDEALFLGGLEKGPFLSAFDADIFFDDQSQHCLSANAHVATGHVPAGICNDSKE